MRFIIHPQITRDVPRAIAWVKSFVGRFDTSMVGWLRIDFGREYRDARGRRYHKYRGVYGRCWYATAQNPTIRLSCQVPGPFPCAITTRKRPVYRNADGSWPKGFNAGRRRKFYDRASGRCWVRVYGETVVKNFEEAIVWIVAHEAFHWLRKTGQIAGRNTEIEADGFADDRLDEFRRKPPGTPRAPAADGQLLLWDLAKPMA